MVGLGVPVAPSFLVLDDEETNAYDLREAQGVSLSALLAECQASESVDADSSPVIEVTGEAHLDEILDDAIEETLTRSTSKPPVADELWIKAWSGPPPPMSVSPTSRPLRRRSWLAKSLLATIAIVAVVLLASEIASAAKIPWLDPRPALTKGVRFAREKIPWDRLPKLPSR